MRSARRWRSGAHALKWCRAETAATRGAVNRARHRSLLVLVALASAAAPLGCGPDPGAPDPDAAARRDAAIVDEDAPREADAGASDGGAPPVDAGSTPPPRCVDDGAPVNTWTESAATIVLPSPDLQQANASGYNNAFARRRAGEIVFMDGVRDTLELPCRRSPGFYANAVYRWSPTEDRVTASGVTLFGGGSYGGGCLMPGFEAAPTPAPRHTYDGFAYVEPEDAAYLMLGASGRVLTSATPEAESAYHEDAASTWRYLFAEDRWEALPTTVRTFWPSVYTVSDYESHLVYWPEGDRLLFVDDNGAHYAEMQRSTHEWADVTSEATRAPFTLYNARSAWDHARQRWLFRNGTALAAYDPTTRTWTRLADVPFGGSPAIAYVESWDVFLSVGSTAHETAVYEPDEDRWSVIDGGDIDFGARSNPQFFFLAYDIPTDRVGMLMGNATTLPLRQYTFRYLPAGEDCP